MQLRFATAVAKVESARAYLHEAFDAAWQGALDGRSLDLAGKARLLLASRGGTPRCVTPDRSPVVAQ